VLRIEYTKQAQDDLNNIKVYTLLNWGNLQSVNYILELHQTVTIIAENPRIGILRDDVLAGVHSFPYMSHVIYYFFDDEKLEIFAVLHKSQLPIKHLKNTF
jgi:toxin ParE1/3/4